MPTPSQVVNRARPSGPGAHYYTATVNALGPPIMVALDPGGALTAARGFVGATYAVGQRVLVLTTTAGNYILGRIT
jgi:hypothetical protein